MYRVYVDGLPLYDTRDDDLTLINPTLDLEDNSSGSFDFTITPKHPRYDDIKRMTSDISVFQDDEELWSGRPIEEKSDFHKRKKFHCEGELAYLKDTIQEPAEYHDLTVRGYLETLLNIHNSKVDKSKKFIIGIVTVTDPNDKLYKYTNWESTLDVIKSDLVKTYGGHLRIRKENGIRYLDYLAEFPRRSDQVIRFGENLLDFTKNFDLTDICTVVTPLGAKQDEKDIPALEKYLTIESVNNGKKYLVNDKAMKIYGWIEKTVKFDKVTVPSNLKTKGLDFLKDSQFEEMILEIKAVDLHNLNVNFDNIKILDVVRAYSLIHGFDKLFPVTKMKIILDKPSQNIYTLGLRIKHTMTEMNNSIQNGMKEVEDKIPKSSSIIQEAVDNASQLLHNALNGHVVTRPDEQLIMDTDDIKTAKKVWRWNLNGLGYSRTGYNGAYESAITMDGQILGDRLVAHSVTADKIDVHFREKIGKAITSAELNANTHTDDELKNYYTSSEVETRIYNTALQIEFSAGEKARTYVDKKLVDYTTSADLKIKTDAIESEVKKKVNNSEFSTKIEQNSKAIKIAWNNISNYIQFESGELRIYDRWDKSTQKLVSKFNSSGEHFYRDGKYLGKIGTNNYTNEPEYRGLVFDLDWDANYMCWASKETNNANEYQIRLIYHNFSTKEPWGLHFQCPTYSEGNLKTSKNVQVVDWSDGDTGFRGGGVTFCDNGNHNAVEINGQSKMFNVYNNVGIHFYNNLDMHGYSILNQSDARIKKNIKDCTLNALDVINGIDLKEYDWIQTGKHEKVGVIAQQLLEVEPELVDDSEECLKIKTTEFIFYLIKAIQELSGKKTRSTWKDPFTMLDKMTFCKHLDDGNSKSEAVVHEPIVLKERK